MWVNFLNISAFTGNLSIIPVAYNQDSVCNYNQDLVAYIQDLVAYNQNL